MPLALLQILFLAVIAFQDYFSRSISIVLIVVLSLLSIAKGIMENNILYFSSIVAINFLILILVISLLLVYYIIRTGKLTWIFDRYIGWGDIIFFVALSFMFSPLNFIVFFTSALIISLMSAIVINLTGNKQPVPLAGIMATVLIPVILFSSLGNINCYSDNYLILLYNK